MADKVEFGKLNKALQPVCVSRSLIHVRHQDITSALEAPTTEFVLWTLHEGADRDAYRATAQRLVDAVSSELPGEFFGGGFGEVVEDERKFSVVFGWHSVEVRPVDFEPCKILSIPSSGSTRRSMVARRRLGSWRNSGN